MTNEVSPTKKNTERENLRKAIRYLSYQNKAVITLKQRFKTTKYINIEVINISSTGARFSTKYKFSRNTKIVFNIRIKGSFSTWKISSTIVRLYKNSEYGIIFNEPHHDLIDQIMKSGNDLNLA